MMKPVSKITAYIAYGLLAAVFFSYYLFPQQTVLEMVSMAAAGCDPQLAIKAEQVKPKLPPGLNFKKVTIDYNELPVFTADRVKLTPTLASFFKAEKEIAFTAYAGEGSINGRINLDKKLVNRPSRLVATATGIDLDRIALLRQFPQVNVQGKLNVRLDYDGRKGSRGSAHIEILASNVELALKLPLVPLDKLAFSRIDAQLSLTGRRLSIKRCQINGEQISGKVSGHIVLLEPRQRSRISLTCNLIPEAGLPPAISTSLGLLTGKSKAGPITIRINGTFKRPQYTIR